MIRSYAPLAQLVEQVPLKDKVLGPNPRRRTKGQGRALSL